jgi:hypothetical protein
MCAIHPSVHLARRLALRAAGCCEHFRPTHSGGAEGRLVLMRIHHTARWLSTLGATLATLALLAACAGGSPTGGVSGATATATATSAPTATTAATSTPSGYAVKVYFAQHPASDDDPSKVFAVQRTSPTLGVATYAIGQLLAGPSASEQSAGYYTPWAGALTGSSNCGGADFTITLDHRGSAPAPGVATLQFCRTTQIAGELAGARMSATAQATLLQFPNIQKAVILTSSGACFDDLSGLNRCLSAS